MPLFYSDADAGLSKCKDECGDELTDLAAARVVALQSLSNIVNCELAEKPAEYRFQVDVLDHLRKHLFTVSMVLSETWAIEPAKAAIETLVV